VEAFAIRLPVATWLNGYRNEEKGVVLLRADPMLGDCSGKGMPPCVITSVPIAGESPAEGGFLPVLVG